MRLILILLLAPILAYGELIDLEEMRQDFVLSTKRIVIPEYPTAFNPTINRINGALLLTFRVRDPETGDTSQSGYVWLDEDFNPRTSGKLIDFGFKEPPEYSKMQDPRILCADDTCYIVFNNQVGISPIREIRRMFVAKLYIEEDRLFTSEPICIDSPFNSLQEKNWVPFIYQDELHLAHSLNPHFVLNNYVSSVTKEWDWGEMRGGTPALLDDDHYLGFFHSSKEMATLNSDGKKITHYFMGAYTFKKEPPFDLIAISKEPIVGEGFYNGPTYKTWKPLRVVFPCGFIMDDKYIWVSYGRQDHEIWIVKLNKIGLMESLK